MTQNLLKARNELPKGIQFKNIPPMGYQQEFRDYIVTPTQTYSSSFNNDDIVRIQFNIQDWYIDPYESFIEAEVKLQDETNFGFTSNGTNGNIYLQGTTPPKFYMMDGPSTSLISDYRLEINSKEVERIREYDQLGNILTDLNMYPEAVDQKDFEGYYSIKGKQTIQKTFDNSKQVNVTCSNTASNYVQSQFQTNNPLFTNQTPGSQLGRIPTISEGLTTSLFSNSNGLVSDTTASGTNISSSSSQILKELSAFAPGGTTTFVPTVKINTNPVKDIIIGSNANNPMGYTGQMWGESTILGNLTMHNSNFGIFGDTSNETFGNNPCQQSPKLDQIDGHNIILTNLPISKIYAGNFAATFNNNFNNSTNNNKFTSSRAYMQIPLLSGVLGVLIPQDRWQLIPSSSLGQVNMEFRFNQFAFISHDCTDPQWQVIKFQLKLRMYKFDEQLQNQLRNQVQQGIQLHSQIFSMGPVYTIQPNVSVTNNWQLNNGIPSLKQLFFWFIPNDYQYYYQARKNYRISHNITSMQLKIGSNYIPQLPITGHAGNIVRNSTVTTDNSVFLSELQAALNMLFDTRKHISINKLNFAINERPYDVSCLTYHGITPASYTLVGTAVSQQTQINQLQQYGYFLFQELRCRGKALYAFNLEMDKKNDETITGINTTKIRPIELILRSDEPIVFPRLSTMYVMYLSDFVVSFNGNDTSTEGQG